jgi:DNA-binding MurR/RpiR family transcriptional regulator
MRPSHPPGEPIDVPALIRTRLDELSPNDRRVATWLLEHPLEASLETADSLARKAGVSKAAVVRFGTRLGFGGYAGLHEAIARGAIERLARHEGERSAPRGHVLDRWQAAALESVEATRRLNRDEAFDRAAAALDDERGRTYVCGLRTSSALAEYGFFLLNPLLANVQAVEVGAMTLADTLIGVGPEDRLLAITFRRHAKLTLEVIDYFHAARAAVVLVTDDPALSAARAGDHVLACQRQSAGLFGTGVGGLFLIEALAAAVAERVEERGGSRLGRVERLWDRFTP